MQHKRLLVLTGVALLAACSGSDTPTSPTRPAANPAPRPSPTRLAISTDAMRGWQSIDVFINGQFAGTLRRYFEPDAPLGCESIPDARVVATVQPGTVSFAARSDRGATWESTRTLTTGECFEVRFFPAEFC